ncbi:helix-turn-helix domain-containing protein [Synechococcus sp. J7-Johnson]|uniref:helix-turn-helix domain-containing protein n=1 Tax=Synechococcus sp. J7-Johnson TaxID=2823737 RepID=UPI0020CFA572|nr:helix-turn-helix domain-containing protein [Synechococcus sp. J7-Johnson]MCP9841152.1 helix-turn-helix domain-containing protein [Synechococcus sp. J7-Johnson]
MEAVTFSEAARRVGISRATLYRWRANGLLAAPHLRSDGRLEMEPPGAISLAKYCECMKQYQFRY